MLAPVPSTATVTATIAIAAIANMETIMIPKPSQLKSEALTSPKENKLKDTTSYAII